MKSKSVRAGMVVKNTGYGARQDGLVDRIVRAIDDYDLDIFVGPEWLFTPPKNHRLYTSAEKDNVLDELVERTKKRDSLIIPGTMMWEDDNFFYNSAPIIHKGRLLGLQCKYEDGGSAEMAEQRCCYKLKYRPKQSEIYDWNGRRLGVDICADHRETVNMLIREHKPFLDLYVLVSCGMDLDNVDKKSIPINDLGIALCSDGFKPTSQCIIRNHRKYSRKSSSYIANRPLNRLDIYEIGK